MLYDVGLLLVLAPFAALSRGNVLTDSANEGALPMYLPVKRLKHVLFHSRGYVSILPSVPQAART